MNGYLLPRAFFEEKFFTLTGSSTFTPNFFGYTFNSALGATISEVFYSDALPFLRFTPPFPHLRFY